MPATRPFSPIKKNCCVCACAYASLKAVVFALVASIASGPGFKRGEFVCIKVGLVFSGFSDFFQLKWLTFS